MWQGYGYDELEPDTHETRLSWGNRCCGADRVRVGELPADTSTKHGFVAVDLGCSQQQYDGSAGATTHFSRRIDGATAGWYHSGASLDNGGDSVSSRVPHRQSPRRRRLLSTG